MNLWQGRSVRLRALLPEDWEYFHELDQDAEVARRCDRIYPPRSQEGTRLMAERQAQKGSDGDSMNLGIETLAGELVGTINSFACDLRGGTFRYGICVAPSHQRKGYAREAIVILLRYFFEELRYQKVTVNIHAYNESSVRLHESLSFQLEGRLRRMVFTDGRYHDELHYGLTAEEFAEVHNLR